MASCQSAEPPAYRETLHLHGDPYQRGLEHGQKLSSKIKSFYTTLLATSLFPYLSRQQPEIAAFLKEYNKPKYLNGNFAYEVLYESAKRQEKSIPRAMQEEMRGIADGSGLSYDQVLVLNTFVDTVMSVRGVAYALTLAGAPVLEEVELLGGLASDGIDNDGDGQTDEADEARFPYEPSPFATRVEVPATTQFRFFLSDPDGVDPATLRLQLNDEVFEHGHPSIAAQAPAPGKLEVTFTPPAPLEPGTTVSIVVMAGDALIVSQPPPDHAHFMRDEQLTFTVKGAGKQPFEVPNRGYSGGRTQAPAWAYALRGSATANGQPLLATSFALLDANTSHRHTALFVHHPDKGKPFAVVGWAGVAWGFSGLNDHGVGLGCTYSDTLDSTVVGNLIDQIGDLENAKLFTSGKPIGVSIRAALETATDATSAIEKFTSASNTFGWNCLVADSSGALRAVEVDADVSKDGLAQYGPELDDAENRDAFGRRYASVGPDDLRIASHFQKNTGDMYTLAVAGQRIQPQRFWSSYYFRSLRAFHQLGEQLQQSYGSFSTAEAFSTLRDVQLNDQRDGMNAVVIEPAARRIHSAMGQVPPGSGDFLTLEGFGDAP